MPRTLGDNTINLSSLDSRYLKLDQTTPQTIITTNLVTNLNADLLDGYHKGTSGDTYPLLSGTNTWSNPQTLSRADLKTNYDSTGLILSNPTAADASNTKQCSPSILMKGQGWVSNTSKTQQFAVVFDPMDNDNPTLRFYLKKGTGSWTEYWNLDSNTQYGYPMRFARYDARETLVEGIGLKNDASATATYDQYSPYTRIYGQGWKTGGTPAAQYMSLGQVVAPEQGVTYPIGVYKFFYGINTSTPVEANELVRWEWGDRLGVVFNDKALAGYNFRVEGNSDANLLYINGADNNVGIGKNNPATGAKLDINGNVYSTSISTDAGANKWKFGGVTNVGGGVSLDTARYLTVNINGTDYYIALVMFA